VYLAPWIQQQIDRPPAWVKDIRPLRRLVRPLAEHGIFKVAMHNLRGYRERVIPIVMSAEEAYSYVREFVEPDIIFIDANKDKEGLSACARDVPSGAYLWRWLGLARCARRLCGGTSTRLLRCGTAMSSPSEQRGY
jgi:hypothetical protein